MSLYVCEREEKYVVERNGKGVRESGVCVSDSQREWLVCVCMSVIVRGSQLVCEREGMFCVREREIVREGMCVCVCNSQREWLMCEREGIVLC